MSDQQPGQPIPGPYPPQQPYRQPPPPAKKSHKRWIIPTCTAIAGIVVGAASAGGDTTTPNVAGATATVTVTQPAAGAQQQPGSVSEKEAALSRREVAVALRESKVALAERKRQRDAEAAKSEEFGDGTYLVGSDIQPGQYRSKTAEDLCYWARLRSTDGGVGSILANNVSNGGQQLVTIKRSDKAFETRSCGTWTKVK